MRYKKTKSFNCMEISKALIKQISWLQTWKTTKGAYNGYVVHRYDLKRMFKIHDTPWSQGPIINGYINLYAKIQDKKWLKEAISAADLQCQRLQNTGEYTYAGFEDDRFSSLVHNSLANCALLDLAEIMIKNGMNAEKYLKTVKFNIDNYIIGQLWDEEFGAFKFSFTDFYSQDKVRFVVNMNSVAAESLIKLSYLTDEKKYQKYAIRIGEWILKEQMNSNNLENGGINYSQVQPRVLIAIYTALAMRGLDDLFDLTNDIRYFEMIKNAAEHLMNLKDPETKLFYHALIDGELIKYPEFIAGSGIIFKALDDAEKVTGITYDYEDSLNAIIDYQLSNGGFSNFIGYRFYGDKKIEVWEDITPIIGWNTHLFEFLTRKIENFESTTYSKSNNNYLKKNFYYAEGNRYTLILSIWPIDSFLIYFLIKKMNIALLYISGYHIKLIILKLYGLIKGSSNI